MSKITATEGMMKPMEAYRIISQDLESLFRYRAIYGGKGYSMDEIHAQVIAFEALRRMEEDERIQ